MNNISNKYKKILAGAIYIIVMVFITASISGCSPQRFTNSKDYLYYIYSEIIAGELDYGMIYDTQMSSFSREVITKEEYILENNSKYEGAGLTISGVQILGSEKVEMASNRLPYDITKVNLELTCSTPTGEVVKNTQDDYVVWQGGTIKMMYGNYLAKRSKDMTLTHDSNPIHCERLDIYTLPSGLELGIIFNNSTGDTYQLGTDGTGAKVSAAMSTTYEVTTKETQTMAPGENITVRARFNSSTGELKRVIVSRIYRLAEDGTLVPGGDGLSYSMSFAAAENAE